MSEQGEKPIEVRMYEMEEAIVSALGTDRNNPLFFDLFRDFKKKNYTQEFGNAMLEEARAYAQNHKNLTREGVDDILYKTRRRSGRRE